MSRSLVCLFVLSATSDYVTWTYEIFVYWSSFPSWKFYLSSTYKPFTYYKDLALLVRRSNDDSAPGEDCRICYGEDECLYLSNARCDYFVATSSILGAEQDIGDVVGSAPQLRAEVDGMLYDVVEKASSDHPAFKCIPFISRFTDCNKDNTCTGCRTCDCDASGAWNCTLVHRCRADQPRPPLDHRMLMIVLENLKGDYINENRVKRSFKTSPAPESTSISYEGLQEWMYGNTTTIENFSEGVNESVTATEYAAKMTIPFFESNTEAGHPVSMDEISEWLQEFHAFINESKHNASYDTIAFQDLMDDITNRNNTRRKPPHDMKAEEDANGDYENNYDYPNLNYEVIDSNDNEAHEINEFEYGNTVDSTTKAKNKEEKEKSSATETIIDLLQSANKDFNDYMDDKIPKDRPDDSRLDELNAVNIMKREVPTETNEINESTTATNAITTANTETTIAMNITSTTKEGNHLYDLKHKVLHPLNTILKNKENEINQLIQIREQLIIFINFYKNRLGLQVPNNLFNYTGEGSLINVPIMRSIDVSLKDKYLLKLKRDVYTVIKDVVTLQKMSKSEKLPDEVKFLAKCLQQYLRKKAMSQQIKKNEQQAIANDSSVTDMPDTRRVASSPIYRRSYDGNPNKEVIIKIIELIDKNSPRGPGLRFLSQSAQKIIKRIIDKHYIDEFATIGLRVYDPHYNLTNDLRKIGTQWKKLTYDIETAEVTDKLYRTKLLHLELETDINRMNDALALINFAHSRRMVPVEESVGEDIMMHINEDLLTINRSILDLLKTVRAKKKRSRPIEIPLVIEQITPAPRMSFFKQLKTILRTSKKDLMELMRNKIPRSLALKQLAKKKLTELKRQKMNDLEEIMLKWQNGLGIITERSKRSAKDYDSIRNRIKSIIPKYLRGKVHPAIISKDSKKGLRTKKLQTTTVRMNTTTAKPRANTTEILNTNIATNTTQNTNHTATAYNITIYSTPPTKSSTTTTVLKSTAKIVPKKKVKLPKLHLL